MLDHHLIRVLHVCTVTYRFRSLSGLCTPPRIRIAILTNSMLRQLEKSRGLSRLTTRRWNFPRKGRFSAAEARVATHRRKTDSSRSTSVRLLQAERSRSVRPPPLSGIQKQGGSILLSYTGNHGDNPYKGCPCSFCRTRVSSSQVAATPTTTRVVGTRVLRWLQGPQGKIAIPINIAVLQ